MALLIEPLVDVALAVAEVTANPETNRTGPRVTPVVESCDRNAKQIGEVAR